MGIGGGATITYRIQVPFKVDDCVEIFSPPDPPVFLFDSSWNIAEIISTEKDFFRNERCKYAMDLPCVDSCINDLVYGNGNEKIKALKNLVCFYDTIDNTFSILHDQFKSMENERLKAYLARDLRFTQNFAAIPALIELAEDTCEYVRLEVGRSLAFIGEKEVSFELLAQLWEMGIFPINGDRFNYFTASMRNINTPKAIDFLELLTLDTNQYCALDASICLLQLGRRMEGLNGIEGVINTDDPTIFKAATRALHAYFPDSTLVETLQSNEETMNMEIVNFRNCIIKHYGGANEN